MGQRLEGVPAHDYGMPPSSILEMGEVIRQTAELTADRNCIGAGKLVVFCNAVDAYRPVACHGNDDADDGI